MTSMAMLAKPNAPRKWSKTYSWPLFANADVTALTVGARRAFYVKSEVPVPDVVSGAHLASSVRLVSLLVGSTAGRSGKRIVHVQAVWCRAASRVVGFV